jgi:hypothetical protein
MLYLVKVKVKAKSHIGGQTQVLLGVYMHWTSKILSKSRVKIFDFDLDFDPLPGAVGLPYWYT